MGKKAEMILATGNDPRGRGAPDGFTLVEVLISVAILALSTVVILQALARGAHATRRAQTRLSAYAFVAQKLAELELTWKQGATPATDGVFQSGQTRFTWQLGHTVLPDHARLECVILNVLSTQGRDQETAPMTLLRRVDSTPEQHT